MEPVATAFELLWPQAQRMNLLDDSLSADLARAGSLKQEMVDRMVCLAQYAKTCGADAILFTCSAFGPAIDEVKRTIGLPTLKPNEAMFSDALDICEQLGGERRIGLLTTFAPSEAPMRKELLVAIKQRNLKVKIEGACATGGMTALNAGDAETHDRLILESARTLASCDVLMLGQFSMARAQKSVAETLQKPVLTSPYSAVRQLKATLSI
jgi:Asp/Glu/hydantoin racemase